MDRQVEESILKAHPIIYSRLFARLPDGQYFECGDGWQHILLALSRKLENEALRLAHEHADLSPTDEPRLYVAQVKEEFAGLRVHVKGGPISNKVRGWLVTAEDESRHICEICGATGTTRQRQSRGIRTLCDAHAVSEGYVES